MLNDTQRARAKEVLREILIAAGRTEDEVEPVANVLEVDDGVFVEMWAWIPRTAIDEIKNITHDRDQRAWPTHCQHGTEREKLCLACANEVAVVVKEEP